MLPTLFHLGHVPVTSWPPLVLLAFWVAYFSLRHEARDLSVDPLHLWYFCAGGTAAGFAGSHWMFGMSVGAHWDLGPALAIWSGLSFYGGLVLATAYAAVAWRLLGWNRRFSLGAIWDCMAPATAWAVFMGRLGCTLYGCCYGSPSGSHWGYVLNRAAWDFERRPFPEALRGVPLHPATLYEALGLLLILGALAGMRKHEEGKPGTIPPGARAAAFYVLYGVLRFFVEYIRLDARGEEVLGFYPSQWVSIVTVPIAAACWAYASFRPVRGTRLVGV